MNVSWQDLEDLQDTRHQNDNVPWQDTRHQRDTVPWSETRHLPDTLATRHQPDTLVSSSDNQDTWTDTFEEPKIQNVVVLSLVLSLSLLANLAAFSVIMFRKTRFGNGQFAVLILCLTVADLLTVTCGLLGGLILEAAGMTWGGTSSSCGLYYFLTSWFLGLASYLIVVLVGMLHVKRSTSWLARLQECRLLLISLILTSLLPALPELFIRSTVTVYPSITDLTSTAEVCIISAGSGMYGAYVTLKLVMKHLLPLVCVVLSLLYPCTQVAKRLSSLFLGGGATCECGPCGTELRTPHACAKMAAQCRPDVVRDAVDTSRGNGVDEWSRGNGVDTVLVMDKGRAKTTISVREDPHRKAYKRFLAYSYIATTSLYLIIDVVFQIQSAVSLDSFKHQNNLATLLYFVTYLQLMISPLIFIASEFFIK